MRIATPLSLARVAAIALASAWASHAYAYPPAVGITGTAADCASCHVPNGPWADDQRLILDLLDRATGRSLRDADGEFVIRARPGERRAILVVIGRTADDPAPAPVRNGWTFVDPTRIREPSLGPKFVPGWEVDLPLSCRLVGDAVPAFPGATLSVLPMTVSPLPGQAADSVLEWQVLMTSGASTKGDARSLTQNAFVRTVRLEVAR